MNEKEELFVEGKEGEEDLLDFEFEEMPGEITAEEVRDDASLDEEILELTDIIKPGDVGVVGDGEKSVVGGDFEFDAEELGVDSIDFDEDLSASIGEDKSEGEFDFELNDALEEAEEADDLVKGVAEVEDADRASDMDYKTGLFDGDLNEIPEIDEDAVTDFGGGVEIPKVDTGVTMEDAEEASEAEAEEITQIKEEDLEPEPQDLDLGAMIDEIEKEETEAESEEFQLEEIGEEIEEIEETPSEDYTPKAIEITDELVPESITLEEPEDLGTIDNEQLEQIITEVVQTVVEKAVKETMSNTAERVIKETIDALKLSMKLPEE